MRVDTAQRILWFAVVFIVLTIIATVAAAIGFALAVEFIDIGSFISDPTVLAFIQAYPLLIPAAILAVAIVEIIYLAIIYAWRREPLRHRTGLTILGILQLLMGFSLLGLFIILPGLLLEEQ